MTVKTSLLAVYLVAPAGCDREEASGPSAESQQQRMRLRRRGGWRQCLLPRSTAWFKTAVLIVRKEVYASGCWSKLTETSGTVTKKLGKCTQGAACSPSNADPDLSAVLYRSSPLVLPDVLEAVEAPNANVLLSVLTAAAAPCIVRLEARQVVLDVPDDLRVL